MNLRIMLITLLLLTLAACGGGDEPVVEEQPESAPAETTADEAADAPAESEASETSGEAESEEMTEAVEETEMEVEEESAAASSEDGQESESEAMEEAAEEETEMSEDASEEALEESSDTAEEPEMSDTVASGSGWGESNSGAQSACDHPYLPLREGATWTFQTVESELSQGEISWEVISVEGDLNEATAVVQVSLEANPDDTSDDLTLEYAWECADGQGLSSFDFAGNSIAAMSPDITMEVVSGEGEFLPDAPLMEPGYSWQSSFQQTLTIRAPGEDLEMNADMTTEQTSEVLSAGPITAAGVTVAGVQVEQVSDVVTVTEVMGQTLEQAQTMTNLLDLGYGIGIMHQEFQSEFGPSGMDLISFYVP